MSDGAIHGPIVAWAAHHSDRIVHGVTSLNLGGAITTACSGGWSKSDSYEVFPLEAAPADPRCELCMGRWLDQKFIERGLRELVENTYSVIGRETNRFRFELERFSKNDRVGFEWWLGPCVHGHSPRTRCALGCAPMGVPCSES